MKKIFALVLALILLVPAAAVTADDDLDMKKYSYSQLEVIYRMIAHEMMTRPEWKRVTIPVGIWTVGEDIPAGAYSFRATPDGVSNVILWREKKGDYSNNGLIISECVIFDESDLIGKVYLEDGNVLEISGSPVYLCPPVGLGF